MKVHGNARTCLHSRLLMVRRVREEEWTLAQAAEAAGVSVRTVSKWLRCYDREGEEGLLDRVGDPDPDRARPALAPGAARAREPLREEPGRRARPRRRQEARPHRQAWTPGHWPRLWRRPAPARLRARLGVRARRDRRRDPPRLRRGARGREGQNGGRLPAARGRLLRELRHPRRAGDERQRSRLPLGRARARLPGAWAQALAHPPRPAAHEREGRAFHPHPARRLGLRSDLPRLSRAHARSQRLARVLQSTPTTRQAQPPTAPRALTSTQEQRGWVLPTRHRLLAVL